MFFSQYEDSYLIYLAREHNTKAFKILYDKYQIISNYIIRKFAIPDIEKEDILLDSYSVFLKCIQIYKETNKFYNLYTISLKRMIIKKMRNINPCLYLEEPIYCKGSVALGYSVYDVSFENDIQKEIYDLIKRGYSYQEVAMLLNTTIKNVYYQLRRMKDITLKHQKKLI